MTKIIQLEDFKKLMQQKPEITYKELAENWLEYVNTNILRYSELQRDIFENIKEPINDFIDLYDNQNLKYQNALGHSLDFELMDKQLEFLSKFIKEAVHIIIKCNEDLLEYAQNNIFEFYHMMKDEDGEK